MHDWGPMFSELRRVLTPGGRLLVSVDHPFAIHAIQLLAGHRTNYFETHNWTEEWTMVDRIVPMSFWNRPLHAMTDAFTAAGFRTAVISEPQQHLAGHVHVARDGEGLRRIGELVDVGDDRVDVQVRCGEEAQGRGNFGVKP
jgi:SAM-dependent methyltransferase